MRFATVLLALPLALLLALLAAPLAAQSDRPRLDIVLGATPGQDGPSVVTTNLLADAHTRDLLVNGAFPERMHFKLELWRKGGVFDDLDGRTEWDVLVSYDPTRQIFNVVRQLENQFENFGGFTTIAACGRAVRAAVPRSAATEFVWALLLQPHRRGAHAHGDRPRGAPAIPARNAAGDEQAAVVAGKESR